MTKFHSRILAGSLLLLVALLVLADMRAQAPPAQADRTADREEIRTLMRRYARALDTFNADAYAALYTKDGQFLTTKGTQALKDMIKGIKDGREKRAAAGESVLPMYHMTADSWIEFLDATHARQHSYWLTVFAAAGKDSKPDVAAAGRAVDDLVKVDGKWLIQIRNVSPKD